MATNSITQNRNRAPTLEWIVDTGGVITSAVSKQPWPGEAVVNVSIVNWVKNAPEPPAAALLDGLTVEEITPSLRPAGLDVAQATLLPANRGRAFQGPIPVGEGFVLALDEAKTLLALPEAQYADVIRPYLIGQDIAEDPGQAPRRYIIDFGVRSLEEAMAYPAALHILRERVKPGRDRTRRKARRERWWRFGEAAVGMRRAIAPLNRYIAGLAQGKRILFCWADPWTCPSNLTNVFAFESDYAMGVLASRAHHAWAWSQSSTLRVDIRYTPTSAFETFPWPPDPSPGQREEVGRLAAAVIARRQEICVDREIGLTQLLNEVDEGAYADLRALLEDLDSAVAAAYGWPASAATDPVESNRRLLDLNRAITAGDVEYAPFAN